MGQPVDDDVLDEFGAPGGSLDDFLAEEASTDENPPSTDEEQSELPVVHEFDPDADRELTLYGAMRLAVEAAVDALRGRLLSEQANAFRSYLISFRNELTR
jgi:hypothetical protein